MLQKSERLGSGNIIGKAWHPSSQASLVLQIQGKRQEVPGIEPLPVTGIELERRHLIPYRPWCEHG